VIGSGHHQGRPVPAEAPQIAWLLQIGGGIVQLKQPAASPRGRAR
jgi:hypothetical protein